MPFKIVRNDLVKMQVDVIVNTANRKPKYSSGTDTAVYKAAGEHELLEARKKIGYMKEGEVAITPGFHLPAKYIIHAVSPFYVNGKFGEERKLRSCYRNSLQLAYEHGCKSIAFPLIATGNLRYPKEEGLHIAVSEIHRFLLRHEMRVYLVVFDKTSTKLATRLQPMLEEYIDQHYVCVKSEEEYKTRHSNKHMFDASESEHMADYFLPYLTPFKLYDIYDELEDTNYVTQKKESQCLEVTDTFYDDFEDTEQDTLKKRIQHIPDTFQEYLFHLIRLK